MMNKSIKEAALQLRKTKACAIICHENPDGDTLGAARALQLSLDDGIGDVFCTEPVPERYAYLGLGNIDKATIDNQYDLVVFMDCSDEERTGNIMAAMSREIKTINIDHHGTNTDYADINIVNRSASSTCEVVYQLLQEVKIKISPQIADCLYTGIVTDTGMFSYGYTTPKAYRIAADLIDYGADFEGICRKLFRTRTKANTMLIKTMLDRLEFYHDDQVAMSHILRNDFTQNNAKSEDADRLVNMMIEIEDVEIALLAKETENHRYKLSLRSKEGVNISKLAIKYGGGGHAQASGCHMNGDIKSIKDELLQSIEHLRLVK